MTRIKGIIVFDRNHRITQRNSEISAQANVSVPLIKGNKSSVQDKGASINIYWRA